MAMYQVHFRENGCESSTVFHAADARGLKPKHLRAAYSNLRKRFGASMKRNGRKVTYLGARCIG